MSYCSECAKSEATITDLRAQVSQLENDWRKEQEIARKSEDQLFEANKQLGSLAVERDRLKLELEQARKDGEAAMAEAVRHKMDSVRLNWLEKYALKKDFPDDESRQIELLVWDGKTLRDAIDECFNNQTV